MARWDWSRRVIDADDRRLDGSGTADTAILCLAQPKGTERPTRRLPVTEVFDAPHSIIEARGALIRGRKMSG